MKIRGWLFFDCQFGTKIHNENTLGCAYKGASRKINLWREDSDKPITLLLQHFLIDIRNILQAVVLGWTQMRNAFTPFSFVIIDVM